MYGRDIPMSHLLGFLTINNLSSSLETNSFDGHTFGGAPPNDIGWFKTP